MRLGPVGIWEIVAIVVVVLLIFGPSYLPKLARGAGKALKTAKDVRDEVTGAVIDDERPSAKQRKRAAEKVSGNDPPAASQPKRTEENDSGNDQPAPDQPKRTVENEAKDS